MRYLVSLMAMLLLVSCAGNGRPAEPPTGADYVELAKHVLDNTPEHTHFAEGAKFSWCLFIAPRDDQLPQLTQEVLKRLRKRYTVYLAEDEVPLEQRMYRDRRLVGFRNGFMFRFDVEPLGPGRIRIHYAAWEGELAASGRNVTYEWTGKSWRPVGESKRWIS